MTRNSAEALAAIWRSTEFTRGEAGTLCHVPVYGLRLYAGDELVLETSLCWRCRNCYLEDGSGGHYWQFFYNEEHQLLRRLRDELVPPDPIKSAIAFEIGNRLSGRELYDDAIAELDLALALDETNFDAYICRSETYRHLGQYEPAIADLSAALRFAPEWQRSRLLEWRGRLHMTMENYERAVQDLSQAIEVHEADDDQRYPPFELHRLRADAYEKLGKVEEAAADRRTADQDQNLNSAAGADW